MALARVSCPIFSSSRESKSHSGVECGHFFSCDQKIQQNKSSESIHKIVRIEVSFQECFQGYQTCTSYSWHGFTDMALWCAHVVCSSLLCVAVCTCTQRMSVDMCIQDVYLHVCDHAAHTSIHQVYVILLLMYQIPYIPNIGYAALQKEKHSTHCKMKDKGSVPSTKFYHRLVLPLCSKVWEIDQCHAAEFPETSPTLPQTGFLCVALAVLELTLQNRLASNSEVHLPMPPECRDLRCAPPLPSYTYYYCF